MTKDEALTLEALKYAASKGYGLRETKFGSFTIKSDKALAQPEQEPVCPDCKAKVLYECVACSSNNYPPKAEQAICDLAEDGVCETLDCPNHPIEQEPVAKYSDIVSDGGLDPRNKFDIPPQRTWVAVPDEEIKILWIQYRAALPRYLCFAKALLARSKEKNT